MPARKRLVIGLGTGRCGTLGLAALLNGQNDALVTHEGGSRCGNTALPGTRQLSEMLRGHLPWLPDADRLESRMAAFENTDAGLIGDVAFYYLPYVELIVERSRLPVSFVCLKRDREQTIRSFLEHTRYRNHWFQHDGSHWRPDDTWDPCFPKYQTPDKAKCINQYWLDYYEEAERHQRAFDNFQIFDVDVLNDPVGVNELLDFLDIGGSRASKIRAAGRRGSHAEQPSQGVLYVMDEDTGDKRHRSNISRSIENLLKQPGREHFQICIADFSKDAASMELDSRIQEQLRIEHFLLDGPINRSFAINYAYRQLCSSYEYFVLADERTLYPDAFLKTCLDTYISTGRAVCMSGVSVSTGPARPSDVDADSAWTGDGLLIECRLFEQAGGFDEALEVLDVALNDFTERMIDRDAYFVDRNLVLAAEKSAASGGAARDEDYRRVDRKRNRLIPGRDWNRWGDPKLRRRIRTDVARYQTPVQSNRFSLGEDGSGGLTLYDEQNGFRVNEAAAAIYGMCNGGSTVGGMIDRIQQMTGECQEVLQIDVREGLAHLRDVQAIHLLY